MSTPTPGTTVTGLPVGQTRRQTMVVTHADADVNLVHGMLVSRKYPGNYRGTVSMWLDTLTEVTR